MTPMRRDLAEIAGPKGARLGLVLEAELRLACEDHDPFALRLVVPKARRARLAVRHDALDAHAAAREQLDELLGVDTLGQVVQQVARHDAAAHALTRASSFALRLQTHTYCAPEASTVRSTSANNAGSQARKSAALAASARTSVSRRNSSAVLSLESQVGDISTRPTVRWYATAPLTIVT